MIEIDVKIIQSKRFDLSNTRHTLKFKKLLARLGHIHLQGCLHGVCIKSGFAQCLAIGKKNGVVGRERRGMSQNE